MKRWTHPQDFIALIVGVYALLSPLWTTTTSKATTTMVVLGAVTVVLSLIELVRPDMMSMEGLTAVMGVLFFISPWVMGFSSTRPMAWTAWIAGVITFVVGAADLRVTRMHHKGGVATSH
jgi:membrane-bound ClpP family serine protease